MNLRYNPSKKYRQYYEYAEYYELLVEGAVTHAKVIKIIIAPVARALDKLRICVKYPIKMSKTPIQIDALRIKTI